MKVTKIIAVASLSVAAMTAAKAEVNPGELAALCTGLMHGTAVVTGNPAYSKAARGFFQQLEREIQRGTVSNSKADLIAGNSINSVKNNTMPGQTKPMVDTCFKLAAEIGYLR